MICNSIGLTADSFSSIYMAGGAEVEEVYGAINYGEPIYEKQREIAGVPPLHFTSRTAGSLVDYRIYGNTVEDAGCGEQTENLYDKNDPTKVLSAYLNASGTVVRGSYGESFWVTGFIPIKPNELYVIKDASDKGVGNYGCFYDNNKIKSGTAFALWNDTTVRVVSSDDAAYMRFSCIHRDLSDNAMLIEGSAVPKTYIPYGYKIPVTVSNGTDTITTPVYIGDTQLMADEYVSFAEQKIYRKVNGVLTPTDPPEPLPALPTLSGTNILSVETQVQPSNIYLKGKIKEIASE